MIQIDIPLQEVHGIHKDELTGRTGCRCCRGDRNQCRKRILMTLKISTEFFHDVFRSCRSYHRTDSVHKNPSEYWFLEKSSMRFSMAVCRLNCLESGSFFRGIPCILSHFIRDVFFFLIPQIIEHPFRQYLLQKRKCHQIPCS